ncbi:MAG: hypothetical protein EA379_01030 [Phycisphaerales bacterium]|nr:MAG: hypothetical protein EA379_01030 [Phycisphaerales bacterium]
MRFNHSGAHVVAEHLVASEILVAAHAPSLLATRFTTPIDTQRLTLLGTTRFDDDVRVHDQFTWTSQSLLGGGSSMTIEEGATAHFASGSQSTTFRFINHGSVLWDATGALQMNTPLFHNAPNAVFEILPPSQSLYYHTSSVHELRNEGLLIKSGTGDHNFIYFSPQHYTYLNNTGTLEVRDGRLFLEGGPTQLQGSTLAGGTWDVWSGGEIRFTSDDDKERSEPAIITNDASVILRGDAAFLAFDSLAHNRGSFALLESHAFTTMGDLLHEGALVLGRGSSLDISGDLDLGDDALTTFHVARHAFRSEGDAASGTIVVSGAATLDGALRVEVGAMAPLLGESFLLIASDDITGEFGTLGLPDLPGPRFFTVEYGPEGVTLRVIPAPGMGALAMFGAVLLRRGRRAAAA